MSWKGLLWLNHKVVQVTWHGYLSVLSCDFPPLNVWPKAKIGIFFGRWLNLWYFLMILNLDASLISCEIVEMFYLYCIPLLFYLYCIPLLIFTNMHYFRRLCRQLCPPLPIYPDSAVPEDVCWAWVSWPLLQDLEDTTISYWVKNRRPFTVLPVHNILVAGHSKLHKCDNFAKLKDTELKNTVWHKGEWPFLRNWGLLCDHFPHLEDFYVTHQVISHLIFTFLKDIFCDIYEIMGPKSLSWRTQCKPAILSLVKDNQGIKI